MIKAERCRVRAISAPHWACNGYSSAPTGRAVLDLDTRGTSQEQLGTEAAQGKPHLFPEELPAPSPPLPPAFPCKCALPTQLKPRQRAALRAVHVFVRLAGSGAR